MKKLLIIPMLFMCSMVIGQSKKIIGKPIKIENLEVAQNDFPKVMTWYEAKKACYALGSRWRLPTKDELDILYKNKIGGFADGYYWSSTKNQGYYYAYIAKPIAGLEDYHNYALGRIANVRAVRDF